MRFSVIMPCKDGADRIPVALRSIRAQTFEDYEIIVCCDACEDDTKGVSESFGAKTIECNFRNAGLTKNPGIDAAQGEYLLFCNDDDWFLHDQVFDILDRAVEGFDVLAYGFIMGRLGYMGPLGNDGRLFPGDVLKAWRREFVGDIRFGSVTKTHDLNFTRDVFAKCPTWATLDIPMYYHDWMRPGSITERFSRGEDVDGG